MKKLLLIGAIGAFAVAVLAMPIAMIIESSATEVYMISKKSPEAVKAEKLVFQPPNSDKNSKEYRDAVMTIYGVAVADPISVVFVSSNRLIRPEELPSLTLLPIDLELESPPWQGKTFHFVAIRAMIGAAIAGVILIFLWSRVKKPAKPAPPPAA